MFLETVTDTTLTINGLNTDNNAYTFKIIPKDAEGNLAESIEVPTSPTADVKGFNIAGFESYPNPVRNFLHINSETPLDSIKIYDVLGQEVHQENLYGQKSSNINTMKLKPQVYFAKIKDINGNVQNLRFIKI